MARVKVTDDTLVFATPSVTVRYPAGYEGPAPDDHIGMIVDAGKGERLSRRGETVGALARAATGAAGNVDHDDA